ncbi:glutathione S-transferase family protein [Rhodoferax sp.]|uniref:glutathione S-transferase family protein n=1 Tax=Rhodoferax sp. TaxID=50421 RepID=UPI00263934C0|nr:glutathione S-transferase family protein [Rhodoferax sp.]MDD2919427.1 glutathione S-transferase family protein [Rhodoferax sp.]
MPNLILHHYPMSPFSEKVRAVLGFKNLAWQSVLIPAVMPKPDLLALTGGYRKTPVLQIGADIYCDTALICEVLEHFQHGPTLYPEGSKGLARILAQWADSTLFWAAMGYNMQKPGMAELFAGVPAEAVKAFAADRSAMAQGMNRPRPLDATSAYKSYLRRLADMLDWHDFLLGDAPTIADFAAYHPLWFTRTQVPAMAGILQATPQVLPWLDRMAALGHGQMSRLSAADAIAVCAGAGAAWRQTDDHFQDDHGIVLGSRVSISAESFGAEPTVGELVAATRTRYTLRRVDPSAGVVRVHFPRVGYALKQELTA